MNAFTQGFISSAKKSGLTSLGLEKVIKTAEAAGELTTDELLAIRKSLATHQNIENYYNAPYQDYAAQLLAERDQNLHSIPELAATGKALTSAAAGGGLGALTGYGAGSALRSGNILGTGVSYGAKRRLPGILGATGATIGALASALPAYTEKLDQSKALRKLHTPQNIQKVLNNVRMDRALLEA
jgi:hypothetical protein